MRAPKVWDAATWECVATLEAHADAVHALAVVAGGGGGARKKAANTLVVSGALDALIKVWDGATFECLRTLSGHTAAVHSVAFSPDGKYVASGSYDNTAMITATGVGAEAASFQAQSLA